MIDQKQEFEIKSHTHRFLFLISLTGFLFLILLLRLMYLQIYQGENFKHFSDNNRFKKKVLIAPRGLILDRKGKLFAGNTKVFQLIINTHTPSLTQVLEKISKIIQKPLPDLREIIDKSQKRFNFFHPVVLKENLTLTEIHHLKQLQWIYPEIQVEEKEKRYYPLKENGAQLLGFIGSISKKEVKKIQKQNRQVYLSDIVGKSGLEKIYDKYLKGQNGFSLIEVNAQNHLLVTDSSYFDFLKISPIQGENISLTLDKDLQEIALKALKRKDELYPRTGAVLIMKTNGEILALLSDPSFNPNKFSLGLSEQVWKNLSSKDSKVFINKVYQEHYPPGSVFKPFMALAALQEGLISEETLIHSPSTFRLGSSIFHDHNPLGYGKINVLTALERSSNTFFYQIGDQLGIDKMSYYSKLFRLGQKTGIELTKEASGYLPQRKKNQIWNLGDTINVSIGQGSLLTTLLQLAVAYNAIATEGILVKPFLVKKQGQHMNVPVILDSISDRIDRKHFITVKKALYNVVQGAKGTARWYQLPFVEFSGKTGTVQVVSLKSKELYKNCLEMPLEKRHHGWFIGFAPSHKPEIIVAVFTNHSCSGSKGSASVARDIIEYYFKQGD
ncbi:MAG: penicillin-binding protein 2 [Bdellovibrionales bacterium]|nr:penicillin-binding protein 2 [Bdellovibrionales bacterium]